MQQAISTKIVTITTVVLLVALGSSTILTGWLLSEKYGQAIESRALAIGHSLESQLIWLLNLGIALENLSGFENQCREVVDRYDGISYAMVVAPDGNIVFHSDHRHHGQYLDDATAMRSNVEAGASWVRRSGDFYEAIIPVFHGSVDFTGTIRIGFPAKLVRTQVRQLLISARIAGIAIIALSAVVLLLLLRRLISNPFNRLMKVMRQVPQEGQIEETDPLMSRQDEFGRLTRVFNELMTKLADSQAEVERHATHLKEVVATRTHELENANRELTTEVEERENAEKRYRILFEDAPVMYVITRHRSKKPYITDCNELFVTTLGYKRKEVIGRKLSDFYSQQSREIVVESDHAKRGLKESLRHEERQLLAKNGSVVEALLQSVPQTDSKGNIIGALVMYSDITSLKAAEKEKEELLAKLQQAKKMEAIGLLAGGVAHDLNNILSGIVSYPELLLLDMPADSPLRKPIETIRRSGERAATIVNDLLTLSRKGLVEHEAMNVNTIIAEFLESPEFEKIRSYHLNVNVRSSLADDLLNILGSPVHLSKVVMNLVSNAAEAMPEGGNLGISTYNQYVDSEIMGYERIHEGDYVVISVTDEGIGMSAEDHEKIFQPFFSKKVLGRSGTGLGMAVVWGTVKDHLGYIDLNSSPGKGSEFHIYLPASRDIELEEAKKTAPGAYIGNGEKVLLVDDVPEQRQIGSEILTKLGYHVETCSSGEAALEHLKTNDMDLVVLDMIMKPGMDGLDAFLEIRKLKPKQKTIIASGFSETDRVREMQKLGAGDYVRKPYSIEVLGRAVFNAIHRQGQASP
jgi:PAS domain S-box-containing protein